MSIYRVRGSKGATLFLRPTLLNTNRFSHFFSQRPRFSGKTVIKYPTHLKRVATLPCEMFVRKNRNDPELTEANSHARLSHSKQLLKNIHPMMLASFCYGHTEKPAECTQNVHTPIKKDPAIKRLCTSFSH